MKYLSIVALFIIAKVSHTEGFANSRTDWFKKDYNIGADSSRKVSRDSSQLKNNSIKFTYKREHYITDSFPGAQRSNFAALDPYPYNFAQMTDTFDIVVRDSDNNYNFCLPLKKWRLTSGFGPRNMFGSRFHYGIDAELKVGDSVLAALPGIVRIVRNDRYGYGNFIVIAHKGGLETLYGHLSAHAVEQGQFVEAGELIGYGGSTGRSTGPHLHFEFRFLGEQFDPSRVISPLDGSLYSSRITLTPEWFAHLNPNQEKQVAHKHNHDHDHGTENGATRQYHTIRLGDTLGHIAIRYSTSVQALCRLNGLSPYTLLRPGQKIKVS